MLVEAKNERFSRTLEIPNWIKTQARAWARKHEAKNKARSSLKLKPLKARIETRPKVLEELKGSKYAQIDFEGLGKVLAHISKALAQLGLENQPGSLHLHYRPCLAMTYSKC